MRKIAAILFLTLFLFNLIGYRCLSYYLQQKEKDRFEAGLDKQEYNENDLITLKVPLYMPYQTPWSQFERIDGEITIDGIIYKYVKRKIEDGQLILLCLPNYKKMQLVKATVEFGNHGNDLIPVGKKGHDAPSAKNDHPNEFEENNRWLMKGPADMLTGSQSLFLLSRLPDGHRAFAGKPPELS